MTAHRRGPICRFGSHDFGPVFRTNSRDPFFPEKQKRLKATGGTHSPRVPGFRRSSGPREPSGPRPPSSNRRFPFKTHCIICVFQSVATFSRSNPKCLENGHLVLISDSRHAPQTGSRENALKTKLKKVLKRKNRKNRSRFARKHPREKTRNTAKSPPPPFYPLR